MKTPQEMDLVSLISTTQAGLKTTISDEDVKIVNAIVKKLKQGRPSWRTGFKSQGDVDSYKRDLLEACVRHKVNTEERLMRGIARSEIDESPFLPAVNQFIKWCLDDGQHWEQRRMEKATEEYNKRLALPKPPRNQEVGKKALSEIKKKLGIS